jgi:hypothetical protein
LKQGVTVWNAWNKERWGSQEGPDLKEADLRHLDLSGINFSGANLTGADLGKANLRSAHFFASNLKAAELHGVDFWGASLQASDFRDSNFREANFGLARLRGANLAGADLSDSIMLDTIFARVNLSKVHGLEKVRHYGPSTIGVDTIYLSGGNIPEEFLRGAGVPESFIVHMKSLVGAMSPIEYYSCFISYSSKDEEFAERLHADLRGKGVRCWFAPEDLKIGARLRPSFDEAIRVHDKLMVLLSEYSVKSPWVEKEVETAFENERQQNRTVLFPLRLDEAVMETDQAWAADIRRTRHIGDFRNWKDHDSYKKGFDRLLRDLKSGDTAKPD